MTDSIRDIQAQGVVESKAPASNGATDENYAYWREHGAAWADEYDKRKRVQPYYHIQEIMLACYMVDRASRGPVRVLEFGCGPGRHLRYLSKIPGVSVHGFDQSEAMVAGCLRWTGQEWIDRNVTIGEPTPPLPFPDKSFDIVYTSEVLIHVRPEHVPGLLRELTRIARREVLHMEPSQTTPVERHVHAGCWNHDLVSAYAALGLACELLPQGYRLQTPARVTLEGAPAPAWSPVVLELCRRLESDLEQGLAVAKQARAAELAAGKAALDAKIAEAGRAAERYERELAGLREEIGELSSSLELARAMLSAKASEIAAVSRENAEIRRTSRDAVEQAQRVKAEADAVIASSRSDQARDTEVWRKRAGELEASLRRAQAQAAAASAELAALRAERAAFVREAESRLAGRSRP